MPAPKHPSREYFVPVSYNAPPSMHEFVARRASQAGLTAAAYFRQIIGEIMDRANQPMPADSPEIEEQEFTEVALPALEKGFSKSGKYDDYAMAFVFLALRTAGYQIVKKSGLRAGQSNS